MIVTGASLAALQVVFSKAFQTGYSATRPESDFIKITTQIESSGASNMYGWMGKSPKMREWVGSRQLKNMKTYNYTIANKDFEATVPVDRNDIEDDNLGLYSPLMEEMGVSAAQHPDSLTFGLLREGNVTLCYDNQYFFDTDHPSFKSDASEITVSNIDNSGDTNPYWYLLDVSRPVKPLIFQNRKSPEFVSKTSAEASDHVFMNKEYLYGVDARCNVGFGLWQMAYASNAKLDGAGLDAAIEKMQSLLDSNGQPMGIKPSLLVVGPKLRASANQTVNVEIIDGTSNANYKVVDVLHTAWLA